jgi:transposase
MMRYELTDYEWAAIRPMLPNKARGVRRGTIDVAAMSPKNWVMG